MSFTIEDILKTDKDSSDDKKKPTNENIEQYAQIACDSSSNVYSNNPDASILHQTLLHRLPPHYYRSVGESQNLPIPSSFNNFFNFEKTVYSSGCHWPYYDARGKYSYI